MLVVDEAGMVPTRQLAQLIDATAAVGGKLVLVGDHRQLPELEAGGAFRGLVNRGLAIELTENHRQVNAWERAALDELRDGRGGAGARPLPGPRPRPHRRQPLTARERGSSPTGGPPVILAGR